MVATIGRVEGYMPPRRLVTLLALAIFINYVDRGNLATAAPVIKNELHLSTTQIGVLLGAFFWTYVPMQLGAGWLAERFPVQRVIALGFTLWSIATMLTGVVSGFVARFGWRALFISLGALSLLWLWPWLTGPCRDLPEERATSLNSGPSFFEIARRRAALGAGLGHFCANYTLYFVLSWLPLYLVRERGFSIVHMAALAGAVYLLQGASAFLTGSTIDRWVQAGATPNRAYKTAMIVSQLTTAICLLGTLTAGPMLSVAFLLLCGVTFGLLTAPLYATAQTFAGPSAAGRWMGLQNFLGNLAGVVGPPVTGFLIDRTGNFSFAFALAIAMALAGMVSWIAIVPRIAPLDWTPPMNGIPFLKKHR